MSELRFVREEDRVAGESHQVNAGDIDLVPLFGIWENTNRETRGILRVAISEREGRPVLSVFGACSPEPCPWGEAPLDVLYAKTNQSRDLMAFSAHYEFGFVKVHLQANLSLGLLVIAGLNTFTDRSGRSNYFSREFFYRASDSSAGLESQSNAALGSRSLARDEEGAMVSGHRPEVTDKSGFVGSWRTTNTATRGIVRIDAVSEGPGLRIQTYGACLPEPCDWGNASAALFTEGVSSNKALAFSASYDFGFLETDLQAKIKKGVLVVAVFNKYKDHSGRSNYFSREFFYRP